MRSHTGRTVRRSLIFLLSAALGGLLLPSVSATPANAAVGFCNTMYVRLFDGDTQASADRLFCYGLNDGDIESEPGNVMGPLGDGNPVVRKDDFSSSETSSGVNSILAYNSGGAIRTVCAYTGKNHTGTLTYIVMAAGAGALYFVDIQAVETVMGSIYMVTGDEFACP